MKIRSSLLFLLVITVATVAFGQQKVGIRSVDFKNHNYGPLCGGPHQFLAVTGTKLVLKHGHANQGDASNFTNLGQVRYLDLDGDGREEAFVIINGQTSGSSNAYLAAYVFGYKEDRAKQLWSKCEEGSSAELKGRTVVFTSPEWRKGDAHCCFSLVKTETFALRGGKVVLINTTRKPANKPAAKAPETIEAMAAEFAAAFDAGDLGKLDAEKPYLGRVTIISDDSLQPRTTRKSFTSLKAVTAWLKRYTADVNFVHAELDHCSKGVCKFKDAEGLLHNSLYLQDFTYTTVKGRHYIKTISILDGD